MTATRFSHPPELRDRVGCAKPNADPEHRRTDTTLGASSGSHRREVLDEAAEYDDPYHRAAVLLFGIQSVHVFEDANKRTAWTVTQEYLGRCGIDPEVPQDAEVIEKIIRRAGLFSTGELARWFETGEIDEERVQ